jgi:Mn2+/Fe2+ NRAMP family transporter
VSDHSSQPVPAQLDPPAARWRAIGPGIIAAATGVGAGDLVATLAAGSRYGYMLLWAVLLGVVIKVALGEAVGRYHLATGSTLLRGWRSLGVWTTIYFGIYVIIWGFVYGATGMTATGLPLNVLFPILSTQQWGALCGLTGLALVWWGGYARFEKIITALVGVMFISVVGIAILVAPNLPHMVTGLVPRLPPNSLIYTLGLLGGVGGTITMAAYGYWFNAKGWNSPRWMPIMRLDNSVSYIMTGVFVIAMLIVGAQLLYVNNIVVTENNQGLVLLGDVLREQFGTGAWALFMVGFWATSMTSILGVWNGVSLMFSDFVRDLRRRPPAQGEAATRTPEFRAYMLWLTFPPLVLLFQYAERPIQLILLYGALGAVFMPFLSATLLVLLNRKVEKRYRSGWLSNGLLIAAVILFAVLCANDLLSIK